MSGIWHAPKNMFYNVLPWFNVKTIQYRLARPRKGRRTHRTRTRTPFPFIQRCSSGAAVASKPLPGRASQLWGWAPSRPGRHGTMHWRTAEGSKAFTMFYHAFPPTPFKEIDMKSHAELGWLMHHDIWSYLLCCHTTLLHDTTSIYIYLYTHNINIIFCQRYLSIHATRIFALKRIRLSDGMHIHFSAKRHFILQVLEVETRTSRPNAEHGGTMQKYSFEKYGAQSLFWEKSVALTVVHRQRRER